jgi:hypothetical protein
LSICRALVVGAATFTLVAPALPAAVLDCLLAAESSSVMMGEPVWLQVECRNPGDRAVNLDFTSGNGVGWLLSPTVPGSSCQPEGNVLASQPQPTYLTVPPGDKAGIRVLLNRWVRFRQPRSFRLTLVDCARVRGSSDFPGAALTNEVTIKVTPLDEQRLAALCEQLAQQAVAHQDAASLQAAEGLSWITLPLAVPYLDRVLKAGKTSSSLAVDGLARIGNPKAVKAMIEAFAGADAFARMSIKNHLQAMQPRPDDPDLRRKLHDILAHEAVRIIPDGP